MSRQKKDFPFSDEELKQASGLVRDSLLRSLPEAAEPPHVFSGAFEEKMDRLLAGEKKRRSRLRLLRAAAAVLAVALALSALWLSTDAEAWAGFQRWFRHITGTEVVYKYVGPSPSDSLPKYDVTWLPEGYVFAFELEDPPGQAMRIAYEKGDEDTLYLTYCFMSEGHETTVTSDDVLVPEAVTVAGMPGDLYYNEGRGSSVLQWFDEEAGMVFGLQTSLDRDLMFQIAESVRPVPPGTN